MPIHFLKKALSSFLVPQWARTVFIAMMLLFLAHVSSAQTNKEYQPPTTRILFLLDASGSMVGKWGEKSKFEISKELLSHLTDSLEKANPNLEFAVRIFGHQSPKNEKNCKDSQLEIPFAPQNAARLKTVLNGISPQGWTPLAYSLFLAANDFPTRAQSQNAIVLITDGIETCDGDPCAAGLLLLKKRISIKPFIIGLGMDQSLKNYFDCVGTYYNADDDKSFNKALNSAVSQSLNITTTQINILDANGEPTVTDIELSLYDAFSGQVIYNFVHTMQAPGIPDTLLLDPAGKYNLTLHTFPPVVKTDIELYPGKHNVIAIDAPVGTLDMKIEGAYKGVTNTRCVVRKAGTSEIVYVQDFNTSQKYLMGHYDLEILTLPRMRFRDYAITPGHPNTIVIKQRGTLTLAPTQPGIGSLYVSNNGLLERIWEKKRLENKETVFLQPGEYWFIYRPDGGHSSLATIERKFTIEQSGNTYLKF